VRCRCAGYGTRCTSKAGQDFEKEWNEAHPDNPISVRYEPIAGSSYNVKLNAEAVAGTLQDIFIVPDFLEYVRRGVLLDLTPYVEKYHAWDYLRQIYPALLNFHIVDGKLYGVPYNLNTSVLYYNRTLFDREGLAYPTEDWTWKELLEAAQRLTKRDARGRLIQAGLVSQFIRFWALWNGARFWNEGGAHTVGASGHQRGRSVPEQPRRDAGGRAVVDGDFQEAQRR